MKKNVLALSVAALVAGFAGSAHAILPNAGAIDGTGATAATKLQFGNTGTGHMLVVPYFSTQNGNSTLLSIINTDEANGKAVKVRFRGAANSDDLFDFQVFLSPGDVWTANISKGADGKSFLTTGDASCTKPAKDSGLTPLNSTPFGTGRLNPAVSAEVKAENTREGYIEIFTMADIPARTDGLGIYPIIKHKSGVAKCGNIAADALTGAVANSAWTTINTDMNYADLTATKAGADAPKTIGLANPTTGLAANWTIINVPKAVAWSGSAAAIETVVAATGEVKGTKGNLVYFPQSAVAVDDVNAALFTADPLMQGAAPAVRPALYDLPDMSTPYHAGSATANLQAADLSKAIAATAVMNEYWTDPAISAKTDWVFSMPTRRYAVAVDYSWVNPAIPGAVAKPNASYNGGNATHFAAANTELKGDKLCVKNIHNSVWDREERQPAAIDDVVVSPQEPGAPVLFCGETSVLSINNGGATTSGVVHGTVAVKDIDVGYQDGWLKLITPAVGATKAAPGAGLPILGQAFVSAFNPSVSAGTAGNFNIGWSHRYARP